MPIIFYSLITILASAVVSLGLLFRLRKDHLLISRPFFWHWALGFAIFGLVHAPVLALNSGARFSYQLFIGSYFVVFVAGLMAYLLFYRGTTLLLTQNKFWINKFPLVVFLIIVGLVLSLFFIFKIKLLTIITIFSFGFILPVNLYLGSVFLYLHRKGCLWDGYKKRPSAILLSLAWFSILILDIIVWRALFIFPADYWVIKLASLKGWYLALAVANLLILAGFVLYNRRLQCPKTTEKISEEIRQKEEIQK